MIKAKAMSWESVRVKNNTFQHFQTLQEHAADTAKVERGHLSERSFKGKRRF